ncbi:MAG: metallopeptidase family protein [Tissierella sp.]|uniref:metallopeptidase family protein n=1 Tax=Tissierella sp. TaxID=41274 RepID=UPI003F9C55DB
MSDFPSINEIQDILEEISKEIPEEFFKKLNEGIVLLPQIKVHPESEADDLIVLGEYSRSVTGRNIKIYYGSFKKIYNGLSKDQIYEKLKDTLLHEFTHHLESLAGERGLEIKDEIKLRRYKN